MDQNRTTDAGLRVLRLLHRLTGVSYSQVARTLGVSRAFYTDVVNGDTKVTPRIARDAPFVLITELGITELSVAELRALLFGLEEPDEPEVSILRQRLETVGAA